MKILLSYLKTGWWNITHNKMYALFYGLGTAITFIFVIILLQIAHLVSGTDAPFVNAKRMVYIEDSFDDNNGEFFYGFSAPAINSYFGRMAEVEMIAPLGNEWISAIVGGKPCPGIAGFVDGNYFIMNQFEFVSGRAFTTKEVADRKQLAVVTENFADRYLRSGGTKIEVQGVEYEVAGVVRNFSSLLNGHSEQNIWLPMTFNKFVPSGAQTYAYYILFKQGTPLETIKERTSTALNDFFKASGRDKILKTSDIKTIYEEKFDKVGGGKFAYGVALIVFFLLFIPALNIMTLSMSNVQEHSKEVALRRAVGASRGESFLQIIVENIMLVAMGLVLALATLRPISSLIERIFLQSTDSVAVLTDSGLGWGTIAIAIMLAIFFSILCGGIPAWIISKRSIALTLKGND